MRPSGFHHPQDCFPAVVCQAIFLSISLSMAVGISMESGSIIRWRRACSLLHKTGARFFFLGFGYTRTYRISFDREVGFQHPWGWWKNKGNIDIPGGWYSFFAWNLAKLGKVENVQVGWLVDWLGIFTLMYYTFVVGWRHGECGGGMEIGSCLVV